MRKRASKSNRRAQADLNVVYCACLFVALLLAFRIAAAQPVPHIYPELCPLECGPRHNAHEYKDEDSVLFHFENWIYNVGTGPLKIVAGNILEADSSGDTIEVLRIDAVQRIYLEDYSDSSEITVGEFAFHDEHDHYHFDEFLHYRLLRMSDSFEMISLPKSGFCFRDDLVESYVHLDTCGCDSPAGDSSTMQVFSSASCAYAPDSLHMGISVGWPDRYILGLDGQAMNVVDVPNGRWRCPTSC